MALAPRVLAVRVIGTAPYKTARRHPEQSMHNAAKASPAVAPVSVVAAGKQHFHFQQNK
jgi:hypothetical protein